MALRVAVMVSAGLLAVVVVAAAFVLRGGQSLCEGRPAVGKV